MFKESKVRILTEIKVLADSGYRGMQKLHKDPFLHFVVLHKMVVVGPHNE